MQQQWRRPSKKERGDETQFPTKIGRKTSLGLSYFLLENFIPSYAFDGLLCRNWPFSPAPLVMGLYGSWCSQCVPHSTMPSHIPCPNYYSCNLYKQPKREDYNIYIYIYIYICWECPKFNCNFFVMGQSKTPMAKQN